MKKIIQILFLNFMPLIIWGQAFSTMPTKLPVKGQSLKIAVGDVNNKGFKMDFDAMVDTISIQIYPNLVSGLVDANNAQGLRRKIVKETSGRVSYIDALGTRITLDSLSITSASSIKSDAELFCQLASLSLQSEKDAISKLVYNLKFYNLWDKIVHFYPHIGSTSAAQRLNLKNPYAESHQLNFSTPSPSFSTSTGLQFVSGSYAFAAIPPDGENYGMSVYIRVAHGAANGLIATQNGSNTTQTLNGFHLNPGTSFRGNIGGVATATKTANSSVGLFSIQRQDNDTMRYFKDGITLGNAYEPFKEFSTYSNMLIVLNGQSNSMAGVSTGSIQTTLIHQKLSDTEISILYDIIQAYNSDLGRNTGTAKLFPIVGSDNTLSDIWKIEIQTTSAAMPNMDGCHTIEKDGILYRLGGYIGIANISNAIYKSMDDGKTWVFVKNAEWSPRHTANLEYLGGKWYIYGSDAQSANNEVWVSSDIVNWTQLSTTGIFPANDILAGSCTHNGYLYRIGGIDATVLTTKKQSVYRSRNGENWELVSANSHPIGGHMYGNVVSFKGRIWTLGAANYTVSTGIRNVYSSVDGVEWRQELPLPFFAGSYPKAWVSDNQMWLLTGSENYQHSVSASYLTNTKQIWSSFDGRTWKRHYFNEILIQHASALWQTQKAIYINAGLTASLYKLSKIQTSTQQDLMPPSSESAGAISAASATLTMGESPLVTPIQKGLFEFYQDRVYFSPKINSRGSLILNGIGIVGGNSIVGDTVASGVLALTSTSHTTKGVIRFGADTYFNEATNSFGLGTSSTIGQFTNTSSTSGISNNPSGFVWKTTHNDWGLVFLAAPASGAGYGGRFHTLGATASDYAFAASSGAGSGTINMSIRGNGQTMIGAGTIEAAAQLQVESATKGFLPPRMTTSQRTSIASLTAGLMVFDTTLSKLFYYSGSVWVQL